MDEQVGRIVNELDRLGLAETTAIVFTSDHGYHLGDHGFWQKANLHEQIMRVPLIVAAPQAARGRTQSIVELVDLYPTLAELAGLGVPDEVQGKSFVTTLADPKETTRHSALSADRGYSLRTADWHYIRYNRKPAELYDMRTDPGQFDNLIDSPDHKYDVTRLDKKLNERLSEAGLR